MRRTFACAALAGAASLVSFVSIAPAAPILTEMTSHGQVTGSLVDYKPSGTADIVAPGDQFTISVAAFNSVGGANAAGPVTATFGQTQTFANAGLGAQTVTVSSVEVVNATTTTDQITISVPNDFLPAGTLLGGQAPTSISVELGNANSNFPNAGNPINFLLPISHPAGYADQFTVLIGTTPAGPFTFTETVGGGNTTLEGFGGVNAGGASLAGAGIRSFTISFSYPNVPEPVGLAGLAVAATLLQRRRKLAK